MDIKSSDNQFIQVLPSLGSSASFSSLNDSITYGHNHSQRMPKGINSLSMSLNLNFDGLTDGQSNDLISLLQSSFYYEAQSWNNTGKFTNMRILPFMYSPFYPYKENPFYCFSFSHNKEYFNVNSIKAKFLSAHGSILENVEAEAVYSESNSPPEYNPAISSNYDLSRAPNSANDFILRHISSEDSPSRQLFLGKNGFNLFPADNYTHALITPHNPITTLSRGDSAFVEVEFFEGSFGPMSSTVTHCTTNRNSIYIDTPGACQYRPHRPSHINGDLNIRMFDFRPSETFTLQHSPKYMTSTASEIYKKFNKYGFNPNLNNMQLSFDNLSDIEVKNILFFLESHLGYKKFGFHFQRDYNNNVPSSGSDTFSPNRRSYSTFYCPEWTHTFKYKDNHQISASFIECLDY